ncbi:SMC-Scp complex subunit ScpB [Magnetospirillum molischianum]|uniref:Predicted transcriptional regulator containing the HTH domain n=1 Tax=Magnetospirillum molischianum DSM 120 TaxID=1150626 RepID=H8FRF3_MAGML|nr:SMC-Scp complex subunit ScpB [Magnetospirillum molischianum]CCG40941.1 Predicted transcriptional regulator containing the HTH domain [Magnetospirillum molischianum DSM 120]
MTDPDLLRLVEAVIFASGEPVSERTLAAYLPDGANLLLLLNELEGLYAGRGISLVRRGQGWAFRTAADLAGRLQIERSQERKLSRATVETLAIIAYHQPVTRAEIEEVRGVTLSKGTLDILFSAGWIRPRGRRATPGRPLTWGTTDTFLDHFGLETISDLPGIKDLEAAGLLDPNATAGAYGNRAFGGGALIDTLPEINDESDDGVEVYESALDPNDQP